MNSSKCIKVLNLVPDDKFIDGQIDLYSLLNRNDVVNEFVCIRKENTPFSYIKSQEVKKISPEDLISYLIEGGFTDVFLHSLYSIPLRIIPNIPLSIRVLWFSWGYDIYYSRIGKPLVSINLYKKITRNKLLIKNILSLKLILSIYHNSVVQYFRLINGVKRVDLYSGVVESEYYKMKENSFFRADRFDYSYGSARTYIVEQDVNRDVVLGNNILLGNSSDYSNNHFDALSLLKNRIEIRDKMIITPLSYPQNVNGVKKIVDFGHRLFGDRFRPIVDFMPYAKYNEIIKSCGYVIMYHERQQALGNIQLCLWNGCKVFLSNTSVLYNYLTSLGFVVFSVQDDLYESALIRLSQEDILTNRRLLLQYYSVEAHLDRLNSLFNMLQVRNCKR